ncbi:MAG: hypothetical protein Q9227_000088 [Pyrenula ochraceoflavens]
MSSTVVSKSFDSASDPVVGILRSFSDEMSAQDPDDDLTKALAAKVASDRNAEARINDLRQDPASSHEQMLLQQSQRLTTAWERFIKKLPKEQRATVRDRPPSLAMLFNTVDEAQQRLSSRRENSVFGRFKGVFGGMCQTFDNYKATVNHEDIAEAVSEGLADLCDNIFYWRRHLLKFQNEPLIQRYSIDLYVVIFDFLVDVFTNWSGGSTWDRLRHSFNRRYFERLVESRRKRIAEISQKLEREARLVTYQATLDSDRRMAELPTYDDTVAIISRLLNGMELRLGGKIDKELRESYRDQQNEMRHIALMQLPDTARLQAKPSTPSAEKSTENSDHVSVSHHDEKKQLAEFVESIKGHVQARYIEDLVAEASEVVADPPILQSLQSWASSSASSPLWIEGPVDTEVPSQNTLTAASLVYTARQSGAFVVTHFCGGVTGSSRKSFYTQQLIALVYSLVAQLMEYYKQDQRTGLKISQKRISQLDESRNSLPEAISLLEDLFDLRPQPLFVVIDSLHLVEDPNDKFVTAQARDLLAIFCNTLAEGDKRLTKTLLTTDGHVNVLGRLHAQSELDYTNYETADMCLSDTGACRVGELKLSSGGQDS